MGYFNYLPSVGYRDENNNLVLAKNILTRAKVLDIVKESQVGSLEYTISDEEKPETIAARVYGRPDYHWVILLFNEILDPYFSWPMSMNEMEKHMESVYSGKALFIYPPMLWDVDKGRFLDRRVPHFEVGDTIQQKNSSGTTLATATVKEWNPDLYKIVVEDIVGSFALQGEAGRNTSVIADPTLLDRDIFTVNKEGKAISAPLARITDDNRYGLHHFEKEDAEIFSPHYKPVSIDGLLRAESPSSLIDRYVLGRLEVIDMGVDINNEPLGYANIVTNIQYEETANDGKRTIKVMRPEYIDPMLRDFRKLFQVASV